MTGRLFKLLLAMFLAVVLLVGNQSVGSQDIVIAESEFDEFSWLTVGAELSFGASVDGYRMDDCGLSRPCRVVLHELLFPDQVLSSFARATSAHIYTSYSFVPLEAGPLRHVRTQFAVSVLLGGDVSRGSTGRTSATP